MTVTSTTDNTTSSQVFTAKVGSQDKTVPWYLHDVGAKLSPQIRSLFETYSKIQSDKVEAHMYKLVSPSYILSDLF
jgi:hypothetical protein